MAKLSGLIASGKIGEADPSVVAAMPALAETATPAVEPTPIPEQASQSAAVGSTTEPPVVVEERIELIPISAIRRSPFQVRTMGSPAYIESLMASIQDSNVISPIVVRPIPAEAKNKTTNFVAFEFVAGEHRAEACKRLGHAMIRAVIRPMTDQAAAVALATDNSVRKDLDDYDRYKHMRMLLTGGFAKTKREVATILNLQPGAISNLQSAFEPLPPEALALLEHAPGVLGYPALYEIRDYSASHPVLVTAAIERVLAKKMTQAGMRAWIQSQLRPERTPAPRAEIAIRRDGYPDIRFVVTDDQVVIKAQGIDPEALHKLVSANLDKLLPWQA